MTSKPKQCRDSELNELGRPRRPHTNEVAREQERCAQACENMIVHPDTWDPDNKLTPAEALTEAARRIRAGEYGAIDWTGWRPS